MNRDLFEMNRRSFVLVALGSGYGLSATIAGAQVNEAIPQRIPFGFTLYGMRKLKLSEALQACAETGYDGVELACMQDWPGAPELLDATARQDLAKRLEDHKLGLLSLMENVSPLADESTHLRNLDRLKRAMELGQELSPKALPVLETILGGKPADWMNVRERMATRLKDWARIAEAARTVIALKPHVAGALHTPEGANWLMQRLESPWLKLAYDFSHFDLQGMELKQTFQEMLPQTVFIHVKDAKGTPASFQFLLPGEVRTDYEAYFKLLKESRRIMPVVVEVSGQLHTKPDYDPVRAAQIAYQNLAPKLTAVGLRGRS